jgi:hypothetical protein
MPRLVRKLVEIKREILICGAGERMIPLFWWRFEVHMDGHADAPQDVGGKRMGGFAWCTEYFVEE